MTDPATDPGTAPATDPGTDTPTDPATDAEPTRAARIGRILRARLAPALLEISDDSARHAHHAAMRGASGGETHFSILIVSTAFETMGRVPRSRLVHDLLGDEFTAGLHALSLTLRTPAEHEKTTGAKAAAI
ncbi:BolA family protein [Nguyenibacter vanlangensis]|uniref:BolA family protein n=1 Tax=Nguyenibacter vanlangensis TaxID=1216886 RepID=A0ABZ3D6M3_9PROT